MEKEVNGFKIIQDLGVVYKDLNINRDKTHFVIAICKMCNKEWKTSYYTLSKIKSCGCGPDKPFKPLPEYINGFKTVKCLGRINGSRRAVVICKVCNKEYEVDPHKLKIRNHCGCMRGGTIASKYAKSHPQATAAMHHMKSRCYDKNSKDFYNYGARGITICKEWLNDINKFVEWSIKNGFEENKELSIDRINPKLGYSPDNCRWTNPIIQGRNTRRVKLTLEKAKEIREKYKINPYPYTVKDLSKEYDVSDATIYVIIQNRIWKE